MREIKHTMKTNLYTIGCVGMTHLGLNHAVAFAEKGFQLICYDESPILIDQLNARHLPVSEPGLDDLVKKNNDRLTFTANLSDLKSCDVIFIAYDVPTDDQGNSNLDIINQLIERVKPSLSNHASLVLLSQLPPGFTRNIPLPKERLFYQVETLVFGRAVERALYPERYIVGAAEPEAPLPEAYQALLASFDCPILTMRYESAELAKIAINMFLVASVTTTNTLAEICENIGADWNDIAPTLRLDKRIGQHAYLTPGLGIAGGNLERDLNTIIKFGEKHKTDTSTVSAWLYNSRYRRDWILRCLKENVFNHLSNPTICVLGLAYKPNTHSVKNSPSLALIRQLETYQIQAHDPIVRDQPLENVQQHSTVLQALSGADVVILMLNSEEYRTLTTDMILKHMRGNIIIDPHRILTESTHAQYFTLGKGSQPVTKKELDYA